MYPKAVQNLIEIFTKFPGVGPRQASRFAFFLLKERNGLKSAFSSALTELDERVTFCAQCFRSMEKANGAQLCSFCRDLKRNQRMVAIVERESDMQSMEDAGAFSGVYHVLGGSLSPLDSESPTHLHLRELFERVKKLSEENGDSLEVILATNSTTEGDTTALYIDRILAPLKEKNSHLTISRLGRGLSLGAELEYADQVTLKNALTNRK